MATSTKQTDCCRYLKGKLYVGDPVQSDSKSWGFDFGNDWGGTDTAAPLSLLGNTENITIETTGFYPEVIAGFDSCYTVDRVDVRLSLYCHNLPALSIALGGVVETVNALPSIDLVAGDYKVGDFFIFDGVNVDLSTVAIESDGSLLLNGIDYCIDDHGVTLLKDLTISDKGEIIYTADDYITQDAHGQTVSTPLIFARINAMDMLSLIHI